MSASSLAAFQAEIDVDASKGSDNLSGFNEKIKQTGGFVRDALSTLAGFVGGAVIIGGAKTAISFLSDAVKDYTAQASASQDLQAQIDNTLKNEGSHAATTSQAINDLADKYANLTTYSEETIKASEGVLARFQSIGADVFPQASQAALDLAAKLGKPPADAALMLGKALDNLPASFAKLEKQGLSFTDSQKQAIIAMSKAGDTAGAQKLFLKDLEGAYGGAAQAAGSTFGGKLDILQNKLEATKVKIGGAVIPVLTELLTALSPLVDVIGNVLPIALAAFSGFMDADVTPAIHALSDWINADGLPLLAELGGFLTTTVLPALKIVAGYIVSDVVPAVIALGKWVATNILPVLSALVDVIVHDVLPTVLGIAKAILDNFLPPLEQLWTLLGPKITPILEFLGALIKDVIGPVLEYLIGVIGREITVVVGLIGALGGLLGALGWVKDKIGDFLGLLGDVRDFINNELNSAINGITSVFQSVFGGLWSIVKAPINSIIDGINHLIDGLDSIHFDIPSWVPGVGGDGFGISIPHIPHLAHGGNLPDGGLVSVGDQDRELAIMPPGSKVIGTSATQQLENFGGGSGHSHEISIDGRKLARAIAPHLVAEWRHATGIKQ